MKIILVEWEDSRLITDGWHNKDMVVETITCVSIGAQTLDDGKYVVVTPNLNSDHYCQDIAIPKSAIKRIRQLKLS